MKRFFPALPSMWSARIRFGTSMQRLSLAFAISCALLTGSGVAGTIYPVDLTITGPNPTGNPVQSDTLTGSISTDGAIGVLGPADVVSWDLNLVDNLNAANDYELTPSDSMLVEDEGSALSATATGLYFDYSGSGEFLIQANNPGAYSGYHYFCLSTGIFACLAGETISPDYIFNDGVVLTGSSGPVGTQPLGGSTPEPGSIVLLGSGLALGALLKTLRRKSVRIVLNT